MELQTFFIIAISILFIWLIILTALIRRFLNSVCATCRLTVFTHDSTLQSHSTKIQAALDTIAQLQQIDNPKKE